jgi:hypothetical protein
VVKVLAYSCLLALVLAVVLVVTQQPALLHAAWSLHVSLFAVSSPTPVSRSMRVSFPASSSSSGPCHAAALVSVDVVQGPSTVCPAMINRVLSAYGSPVAGQGQAVYDLSNQYGVNAAFALAFFCHESGCGTAGAAVATHSWGNIICTPGWPACIGRFRAYPTFLDGLRDYLLLLTREYFPRGLTTADRIIPVYAPPSDNNNDAAYINAVTSSVALWSAGRLS